MSADAWRSPATAIRLGTGSDMTGVPARVTEPTPDRHAGMDTNARSAAPPTSSAINRLTAASALRVNPAPRANGYATSWNMTQTPSLRRDRSQKQNGTFAAFHPNA